MSRLKGFAAVDNEPLYDRVILPSSLAAASYSAFTVPQSQKDPNQTATGAAKTANETNMLQGGRLSDPEAFEVMAYSIIFDFTSNAADCAKIYNNGYIEIRSGGNNTATHRAIMKTVTAGAGQANTDSTQGTNGISHPQAIQGLTESLLIEKGESFAMVYITPVLSSLAGASALINAHFLLWGYHAKSVGKR